MSYSVILKPIAIKQLRKLDKNISSSIISAIENFSDGRECDSKKLKGFPNRYRIRVRDYRAVFDIVIQDNIIYVLRVAHRGEVYKGIEKL